MPLFDLESFAEKGILREATLRSEFERMDWEQFRDKSVHVRGCGQVAIPIWAYLMTAAHLAQVARKITYGEEQMPIPVFVRSELEKRMKSEASANSSSASHPA